MLSRGYRIVARNWRCRSGELDVVAEREDTLVFVEVRSRSGHGAQGTPEESVDLRKIRQVRATAEIYIHQVGTAGRTVSFDVIAVQLGEDAEVVSLNHIRGAF